MEPLGQHDYDVGNHYICGQRRCPHRECRGHLFVVLLGDAVVASYPPIRLDFDPENIPSKVLETFEEARHFKLGPAVYEGGIYPWREPIRSPQRPDTQSITELPSKVART